MKGALDIAELTRQAGEQFAAGASADEILLLLRASGCNVIESIKIMSEASGTSRQSAKQLVHQSAVWSDLSLAHDHFHSTVEHVAEDAQS